MAKTYAEKLLDPRWQKKRLEVLERDSWMCQYCYDSENTLHVHHLRYEDYYKNPWDYPLVYLITACEKCHKEEPIAIKPIEKNIIRQINLKFKFQCEYSNIADTFSKYSNDLLFKLFCVLSDEDLTEDDVMEHVLQLNEFGFQKRIERLTKVNELENTIINGE